MNTYPIVWPGFNRTAWHRDQPNQQATKVWTGSLLEGQRDASGQIYMRNRYYDPATGQFTQTDPIGLAGGVNAYGFAAGDPVNMRDPLGTCPVTVVDAKGRCPGGLSHLQYDMKEYGFWMPPTPQDECSRDAAGGCRTYIPASDWPAIGRRIRQIPNTPGRCGWIRNKLLEMWEEGPEAGYFLFWNGRDVMTRYPNGSPRLWRVGQYIDDPRKPWFEFERRVFFGDNVTLPHEGLHMYYHHFPEPDVEYEELHRRIYQEQAECRLR